VADFDGIGSLRHEPRGGTSSFEDRNTAARKYIVTSELYFILRSLLLSFVAYI
jgi:hypothetical protein